MTRLASRRNAAPLFLTLCALWLAFACSHGSSGNEPKVVDPSVASVPPVAAASTETPASPEVAAPGTDTAAAPAVTAECRAPREPGCAACCRKKAGAECTRLSSTAPRPPDATAWYNSAEALKACPADCRPCASCLERDEAELRALQKPQGCDCSSVSQTIDPCFSPRSCGCYCQRLKQLTASCPSVPVP